MNEPAPIAQVPQPPKPVEMPTSRPAEPPTPPPDLDTTRPYWGFSLDEMLDVMDLCFELIGTKNISEDDGPNKDKAGWIVKFQTAVGNKAEREPWCLGFLQFMYKPATSNELLKALLLKGKINDKQASAYLKFLELCDKGMKDTEGCMDLWNATPEYKKLTHDKPVRRAIGIYNYVGTYKGHAVSVNVVDPDGKKGFVRTDEGNTGPGAEVNREGDGQYAKLRRYDALSSTMMLKGFIVPWATQPKSVPLVLG